MTTGTTTRGAVAAPHVDSLFGNVLVGVDTSAESVEAARQAGILSGPDSKVTLLSAWTPPRPAPFGVLAPETGGVDDEGLKRATAEAALAEAKANLPAGSSPTLQAFRGRSWEEL